MRKLSTVATITAAVLLAALSPEAGAAAFRCRSDPAVLLSNGSIVDISADIAAYPWDIQTVDYTMHIPAGLRVLLVIRTPSWPTTRETFRVVADQAPGVYDTKTVVRTRERSEVRANLTVKTLLNLIELGHKDGYSGETIQLGMPKGGLLGLKLF
jgi:hypothetical protein